MLCFSCSSSNTCPILPTESCLLVWKYVLHSSVKQPTCISPDHALIANPNLIIKRLLFLFFNYIFNVIGLYLHTFAFCSAGMEVCYFVLVHTSVCFAILIHRFLMCARNVCDTNWIAVGVTTLLYSRMAGNVKVYRNNYSAIYGSVLCGYRGSLHDRVSTIFWQECLQCGSTATCTFTFVHVFSNLPFRSQYWKRRRDKGIEFESTLGCWINHWSTSVKSAHAAYQNYEITKLQCMYSQHFYESETVGKGLRRVFQIELKWLSRNTNWAHIL